MIVPGHLVYGTCIICVNLMIVMRFNNYTGWGEVLVYLMILDYFSLMFVEGLVGIEIIPDLYFVFDEMFSLDLVWV